MALNRNHSQEGGVVIPNAERDLAGGWGPGAGGGPAVPPHRSGAGMGLAGAGGGRWGARPGPARPGGCGINGLPGCGGAGLAGADRAALSSLLQLGGPSCRSGRRPA